MIVSVIIPTYNGQRTIKRAIDSVFSQEGYRESFDLEVLICDDRSTDATLDLIKDQYDEYPIWIYTNLEHTGGPNKGRNTGIRHANGDVVAFLDQDDEWPKKKLINQLEKINLGYEFIYSSLLVKQE